MIQRRTLLKSSAAAALGAPGLAALAQQSGTLKLHTFMPPQSRVWLTMKAIVSPFTARSRSARSSPNRPSVGRSTNWRLTGSSRTISG